LLEGFLVVIEPGGNTNGILQHKGEEVGYVVEGQLELTINSEVRLLNAGDSFYFPSKLATRLSQPRQDAFARRLDQYAADVLN